MKVQVFALISVFLVAFPASAFKVTIERADSVAAVPRGVVARDELAPPPGASVAPARTPSAYAPEMPEKSSTLRGALPIPASNPVAVSFCLSDIL